MGEDKNEINDSDKIEIEAPKEPESVPDVNEDQNKNSEIKQSESIKKEQQVQTEEPVISESDANDKDDKQQKSSLDLINDLKNSSGDKAELVSMMNAISKAQHEEKQMTENSAPKPNDASTKSQLKPIEYPTKEDQQLRYIYQTIKPPKDAEKYLTPKHFQEFLLNESAEMLNDEVMLLFRERVKQTIKFHNVPSGAWSGWYTKSKDYSKISAIIKKSEKEKFNVDDLMNKSDTKFEKKDSNIELKISKRSIKGSGRDELGSFIINGSFRGSDWSAANASQFEFDKTYHGKHSVKYQGHLHDDLSMQGFWIIPSLKLGGFFYFQPLAILQAPLSELEGHGPLLMSHRADTHAFVVELSNKMFTELHKEMKAMMDKLKNCQSIEEAMRAQYHLNTFLKMFKAHLDQLNYLFSPHNSDGKKEMLKKETKELDMSMWNKLLIHERKRAKEREKREQKKKLNSAPKSAEELEAEKKEKLKKEAADKLKKEKKKKEKDKLKKLREPKEKYPKWSATQNMRKLLLELVFFNDLELPYRHIMQ